MSSNAERQRKKREKMKTSGEYAKYLEKQRDLARDYRERQKRSYESHPELVQAHKEKENKRRRIAYKKKHDNKLESALNESIDLDCPYPNSNILGKDLKKLRNALPKQDNRAIFILEALLREKKGLPPKQKRTKNLNALQNQIIEFFKSDEISQASADRKLIKKVVIDGEVTLLPLRTMLFTYREAFEIFKKNYPELTCGFTVFYENKPQEIIEMGRTDERVCICDIHANMRMATLSLLKAEKIEYHYPWDPLKILLCSNQTEECFENKCRSCKDDKFLKSIINYNNLNYPISWQKWELKKDGEKFQKVQKLSIEGTAKELFSWISEHKLKYISHVFIKRTQALFLKNSVADTNIENSDLAVIQMDFSENYVCKFQDAPQQANYGYNQVSILVIPFFKIVLSIEIS